MDGVRFTGLTQSTSTCNAGALRESTCHSCSVTDDVGDDRVRLKSPLVGRRPGPLNHPSAGWPSTVIRLAKTIAGRGSRTTQESSTSRKVIWPSPGIRTASNDRSPENDHTWASDPEVVRESTTELTILGNESPTSYSNHTGTGSGLRTCTSVTKVSWGGLPLMYDVTVTSTRGPVLTHAGPRTGGGSFMAAASRGWRGFVVAQTTQQDDAIKSNVSRVASRVSRGIVCRVRFTLPARVS